MLRQKLKSSSRPARSAVVLMLALVWGACGGGGGGGGGSPTSPGGGVAPPTGSITGNLQGTVVGFENPSTSFSGSTVELVGLATTTINGSNEWGFDGVSAGAYTLVFRGAGHLERRMRVNVLSNGISRFSNLELVEPGPFRLDNFDDVYRSFSTPGTIRWKKRPKRVLLDKKSLGDLPQGFDFFESAVREAYSGWLPAHTNGFFSGTKVQSGSIGIGDSSEFSCDDVENGDIVIVGLDECAREDMFITLGTATHCFNTEGNEVVLGAIWFNPCTTESTIKHEIIHTLCAEHLDMEQNNSIMAPSGGPDDLTQWDERWLRYLYSRQPGTRSPDNEPDNQNPD